MIAHDIPVGNYTDLGEYLLIHMGFSPPLHGFIASKGAKEFLFSHKQTSISVSHIVCKLLHDLQFFCHCLSEVYARNTKMQENLHVQFICNFFAVMFSMA